MLHILTLWMKGIPERLDLLLRGPPPRTGAEPGATQAPRPPRPLSPPASRQSVVPGPLACSPLLPAPCTRPSVCLSVCLCVCCSLCSACLRPPSLLSGAAAAAPAGSHGALWTWTDCTLSVVTHSFLRDPAPLPSLAGSLAIFPPVTSSSGPAGIGCVLSQLSSFLILFLLSGASLAPACILHSCFLSFRPLFNISCSQKLP